MRTRKTLTFETIPAWAIDNAARDRHSIAAAFELAGMTGRWVRLTADTQRAVFGAVLFGKCEMLVGDDGIRVLRSVCYGTDFSHTALSWADVERHMMNGTKPIL